MPFTLSHPALVLPLAGRLPMSALVVGSMVPDLPLFVPLRRGYAVTHGALGVVTVDVLLSLAVLALWSFVLRDPLVDLAPREIGSRLPARARLTRRQWLLAPAAAALGAASHVAWDAFTHPYGAGVDAIGWLGAEHAGLPGSLWAQYLSSLVGIAVVGWAVVRHLSRLPVIRTDLPPRAGVGLAHAAILAGAAAAGLLAVLEHGASGPQVMARDGVVAALTVLALGTAALCGGWQLARVTSR